jgi:pyridoxamine 5'-phosphate oxidase family protein
MTPITPKELKYLQAERRLARIATVGNDGVPHVAPVGSRTTPVLDSIDVRGDSLERTKKYRDVVRTGRAAIVIDDVLPPWRPRGIEVRGRAEAVAAAEPLIRIHPERIVAWGLDTHRMGEHNARTPGSAS